MHPVMPLIGAEKAALIAWTAFLFGLMILSRTARSAAALGGLRSLTRSSTRTIQHPSDQGRHPITSGLLIRHRRLVDIRRNDSLARHAKSPHATADSLARRARPPLHQRPQAHARA